MLNEGKRTGRFDKPMSRSTKQALTAEQARQIRRFGTMLAHAALTVYDERLGQWVHPKRGECRKLGKAFLDEWTRDKTILEAAQFHRETEALAPVARALRTARVHAGRHGQHRHFWRAVAR